MYKKSFAYNKTNATIFEKENKIKQKWSKDITTFALSPLHNSYNNNKQQKK